MSHIDELIAEHCPNGVPYLPIGSNKVSEKVVAGATPKTGRSEFWDGGTIPWMSSGEVNKGTIYETDQLITHAAYEATSTKMIPAGSVVMALAGQGKTRGTVARTRIELCTNQSLASIVVSSDMDSDFLYYFLQTQYKKLRDVSSGEGTRGGLNLQMIRSYKVPVPPLEVQREIVRVLDTFSKMEAELEAELEARKQQYEHYRREVLSFSQDTSWGQLSDIVEYTNGKAHEKLADPEGNVAMVTARFISRNGEANRFLDLNDVLTPARVGDVALVLSDLPNGRALARTFYVDRDDSYAINQRVARLRVKNQNTTDPKFVHYFLDRNSGLLRYDNGFDQTHLSKSQVTDLPFPILPLSEQKHIVAILEKFDAIVNDLSVGLPAELAARRQQYEYYRDRLLTFKELEPVS
ncbi:restriction endonuclease subunit S [Glutamicibacter arilaitensis]|uniref:restriction endonuclease subunit S n=1 Tax=Glutamicibacter arilaitensis TaxID=256701 RepID=UPI003FD03BA3